MSVLCFAAASCGGSDDPGAEDRAAGTTTAAATSTATCPAIKHAKAQARRYDTAPDSPGTT